MPRTFILTVVDLTERHAPPEVYVEMDEFVENYCYGFELSHPPTYLDVYDWERYEEDYPNLYKFIIDNDFQEYLIYHDIP